MTFTRACRGRDVLNNPIINFGTAFTTEQRKALGITGLLPNAVISMDAQLRRVYRQFSQEPSDLAKYLYLTTMQDRNETLFYRLLTENIEEMLPIIYTPTIGRPSRVQPLPHKPRGIHRHRQSGRYPAGARRRQGPDDVDLITVTDPKASWARRPRRRGRRDLRRQVECLRRRCRIHADRVMPIVLDTGTDNLDLLNDPPTWVRHSRVRGERYDQFVDRFVEVTACFPNALLHWEDFAAGNAHRILNRYRDQISTFNDDIQGTAGVVVAAILSAVATSHTELADQRIVVHGAGTAGVGIANLLVDAMVATGVSREAALQRFWGLSSRGLLVQGGRMRDFQEPFARPTDELAGWHCRIPGRYELADVVHNVQPTILIGTSAQPGAFTEQIAREMASYCERPIIMPLSNPTARAEALPADLLAWTDGRAMIATGSPFGDVIHDGTRFEIAQANNALIFPGIGLGVVTTPAGSPTPWSPRQRQRCPPRSPTGAGAPPCCRGCPSCGLSPRESPWRSPRPRRLKVWPDAHWTTRSNRSTRPCGSRATQRSRSSRPRRSRRPPPRPPH